MSRTLSLLPFLGLAFLTTACKKEAGGNAEPKIIFRFQFDSTQARLSNTGSAATMPAGHAGQSPRFNKMSAHYLELAPTATTALGSGTVLYRAPETTAGGGNAIDFEKAVLAGPNEAFLTLPLRSIAPGSYEWLRVSIAYQNFDIDYFVDTTVNGMTVRQSFPGTVAGFIGFNNFIRNVTIKNQTLTVNANRKQGFWGFETVLNFGGTTHPYTTSGQAPEGATTVVNPLFATSPVPQGSCVVTAAFTPGKLTITGNETGDIVVHVSLSTNKSFEWKETVADGRWEPGKGEPVVDMGVRGMIPKIQ